MSKSYINKPKKNHYELDVMVKIIVDKNTIRDKYPNFDLNYDDEEDFAEMLVNEIDTGLLHSDNPLREWGYDVVVTKIKPFKGHWNKR